MVETAILLKDACLARVNLPFKRDKLPSLGKEFPKISSELLNALLQGSGSCFSSRKSSKVSPKNAYQPFDFVPK